MITNLDLTRLPQVFTERELFTDVDFLPTINDVRGTLTVDVENKILTVNVTILPSGEND